MHHPSKVIVGYGSGLIAVTDTAEGVRPGRRLLEDNQRFIAGVVAKESWRLGTFDQVSEAFRHVL